MKEIPNAEGYFATAAGEIVGRKGGILKPYINPSNGYFTCTVVYNGKMRGMPVHRLVLEAYIGMRPDSMECCRHLDGNRHNNKPENLTWGTLRENAMDRIRHGTNGEGVKNSMAKLTDADVVWLREKKDIPHRIAAKTLGVSKIVVMRARLGYSFKTSGGTVWNRRRLGQLGRVYNQKIENKETI